MNITVTLKPEAAKRMLWGKPSSPMRPLCALCCGALPSVPFMLFARDGSGASLCDPCADESLDVKINLENFK